MHRIYQSRRKLTASIASAAKAEEELLALSQEGTQPSPSSLGETNKSGRKRPLEDTRHKNQNEEVVSDQIIERIGSVHDEQGTSSIPFSSPQHKKAATLRSPETGIPTSTSIEQASATSTITSITPINEKTINPNVNNNHDSATSAASEIATSTSEALGSALTPDRMRTTIDLRTPSSPLCASSDVEIINTKSSNSVNPELVAKDQQRVDKHNDDDEEREIEILSPSSINPNIQNPHKRVDCESTKDLGVTANNNSSVEEENDEEIQVVSSTTVNPNIQYPHKRTDCGVFSFASDPIKFCEKCYCVVCDIPAKECKEWGDHSTVKCRPVSNRDSEMTDDEGYDVTDEILLESPTTTARDYYNRGRQSGQDRSRRSGERVTENGRPTTTTRTASSASAEKYRILEVLSRNLKTSLCISEGARTEMDANKRSELIGRRDIKPTLQRTAMEGDIQQLGLHSSFFVEGIKIGWPFPKIMLPQRQMAMHIIKGLKRKLHVVVESPTGTGKSVAILCSVLAWQRYHMQTTIHAQNNKSNNPYARDDPEEEEKYPKIIYCSRTHSQVTQMVASLKKTPYRPTMTILGSRDRLCIHKALTGANKKKNRTPLNQACQTRRMNTESDRKQRLKSHDYNDDDPCPHDEINGDDFTENDFGGDAGNSTQNNDNEGENGGTGRRKKPKATCPHFRNLTSMETAEMTTKRFMGTHRLRGDGGGCCGSSSGVGGEESAFGVHDMEDLIRFGKNPFKEETISVYRGRNGKFGFLVNNNTNESGEITRGCHVVSLVDGGAASFEARLEAGDKILKINGKDARTWNKRKVVDLLSQTPKDQPARLIVLRQCSDTPELFDPGKDLVGIQDIDHPAEVYSESSVCPYYLSRAIQAHAELTFAPYNYILDPGIRRVMNISLENAVVVLDEAHNVESTLCEGGSGKYGEIDLCVLICTLAFYSRRTLNTGNISLISTGEQVDTAKLAHDLLMFVEKLILHMQALRQKFETSPGRAKLEEDYKKYRNTPDNHEVELTYDGPTGYGIKGAAVGCQPFLTGLGITKDDCARLLEFALSMEQSLFGGKSEDDDANPSQNLVGESSNVLTILVELLSKLVTATENAEHYYISCVAQANGNLDHAFGIEDDNIIGRGTGSRRFKRKPRMMPFLSPRTVTHPRAFLPVCQHRECNATQEFDPPNAVRHGDYCNGSTPLWECHLVLRLLSPGLLMREISQKCRSVILASGSLAPLPSVCAELNLFGKDSPSIPGSQRSVITGNQLPTISQSMLDSIVEGRAQKLYTNRLQTTPKPLEANHVVNLQKQLLAVSIGHFPTGEKLTVSYSNYHNNPSFMPKFGHAVASIIEGVPRGGCLVFFPSYSFLKKCVASWNPESNNSRFNYNRNSNESNFVWERFLRSKGKIIVEPTGSQEDFEAARDDFKETISTTGSCILLAVFRGKMSEGISFDDENSRAVICIGMPLPNWTDRSVKAKQAYNDEQRKIRKNTCLLPGREFYAQQAYRAISQALGRCIRHGADYGMVILMDSRHCHDGSPMVGNSGGVCRAHSNLPKWMRGAVHTLSMEREDRRGHNGCPQPRMIYGGYAGLRREMRQFFSGAPIASREVLDQWKADRERALSASSSGTNIVFHRDTGNWKTVGGAPFQAGTGGGSEQEKNEEGIQI